MTPFVAELIGTALLVLLGNGVVANVVLKGTKGNNSGWIVITTAWALAVFAAASVTAPFSGAHLNPAVTIGLAVAKGEASLPAAFVQEVGLWGGVCLYIVAQMIGAMIGAALVWLMYKDHFAITEDEGSKLAPFSTGPAIRNTASNFISETIGTFVLVYAILYTVGAGILGASGNVEAPIGLGSVGLIPVTFFVWVIGLALGGTTGYAINPARDLGPRIIHALLVRGNSDWGYSWIPVLGPITGAVLAACLYLAF